MLLLLLWLLPRLWLLRWRGCRGVLLALCRVRPTVEGASRSKEQQGEPLAARSASGSVKQQAAAACILRRGTHLPLVA